MGKTGTFVLWFWGIFGLFFGVLTIIEGKIGARVFMVATTVFAFYELWQRKHKVK